MTEKEWENAKNNMKAYHTEDEDGCGIVAAAGYVDCFGAIKEMYDGALHNQLGSGKADGANTNLRGYANGGGYIADGHKGGKIGDLILCQPKLNFRRAPKEK